MPGIFEGENKCALSRVLQGGEDGAWEIIAFCASVGSPGATEPTPWLLAQFVINSLF